MWSHCHLAFSVIQKISAIQIFDPLYGNLFFFPGFYNKSTCPLCSLIWKWYELMWVWFYPLWCILGWKLFLWKLIVLGFKKLSWSILLFPLHYFLSRELFIIGMLGLLDLLCFLSCFPHFPLYFVRNLILYSNSSIDVIYFFCHISIYKSSFLTLGVFLFSSPTASFYW